MSLLDLSPKDLEKEIERIARENPPRQKNWTKKEVEVLRMLKSKHVSLRKMAETLDRTYDSVNRAIARYGIRG